MPSEPLPSDVEIAQSADPRPIEAVASDLGLDPGDVEPYGADAAKLTREAIGRVRARDSDGKLVLVTAMTATPKGVGKTVTTIGLGQALDGDEQSAVAAIREPSLGPVFGIKGGAAGGGYAQVLPMEDINLHFTGDIHALTAAHDLLSAMIDAHVHHGNALGIDVDRIVWPRALDVNDRALRETVVGLGGTANGPPRSDGFEITAASELMAILGLARDLADLKRRIGDIVIGYDENESVVRASDLDAHGAMATLLKDALRPNLVQTIEGTPAFVHGGPFANIAHGTNTVLADEMGLALADYTVTEAGFAADLGFEKFGDIVSRHGLVPDAVVVVATIRALKHHGLNMWPVDYDALAEPDPEAAVAGLPNLEHHLAVVRAFGTTPVVAVNRFPGDADEEVEAVVDALESKGERVAVSTVYEDGGAGGEDLARQVTALAESDEAFSPLYDPTAGVEDTIETIATEVYGARDVEYTPAARSDLQRLAANGFEDLPVCLSKTQHSLTDESGRKGAPRDWSLTVRRLYPSAGAGFVVALAGDVLTMPGLPADPAARAIDIDASGEITGLF
ncbi:MAG: formate--tetrahydrofolate ligase [Halanaeroarchaeum sp.]